MIKSISTLIKKNFFYFMGVFLLFFIHFSQVKKVSANTVYSDEKYYYQILNEETKEVRLLGIKPYTSSHTINIPDTITIEGSEYAISTIYLIERQDDNTEFYDNVNKLIFSENFTGTIESPNYCFNNLSCIEFKGKIPPKKIKISLSNYDFSEFLVVVPKSTEKIYSEVIDMSINYYPGSDLYEKDIPINPTIVWNDEDTTEYNVFALEGYIYEVIESAEHGLGKVALLGITRTNRSSYISLPEKVEFNGYTYELTILREHSLIGNGGKVIVIPDSVVEMERSVFDARVQLLFLSKNCPIVPSNLIADENNATGLKFIHIPEGVTTISDNAFNDEPIYTSSIILPTTITEVGKKSLHAFNLVTFLNSKPLTNVKSSINAGTTVKVKESAISAFSKVLGNKITVVGAKNVVKSKSLTVESEKLNINTSSTYTIKGTLTKKSNETIYWLSTDTDIAEVSSKGVITPKKEGSVYIVAYTRTSGLHKAIEVNVSYATFDDGIYSYLITNPSKKTVTLTQIRPSKTTISLTIPKTVTYKKVKYTINNIIADNDARIALIPDSYSNNKIKTITFPDSITERIGYLGQLPTIKTIMFQGTTAPSDIYNWYFDGGIFAFNSTITVPKGSLSSYTTALRMKQGYDTYQGIHYNSTMDFNIVEAGNKQVQRFVVDGILYRVIKYADKKNGEVAVKGVDASLKEVKINKAVTYNGYTYNVVQLYKGVISNNKNKKFIIDESITKRSTEEKFSAPVHYYSEFIITN